VAIPEALLPVEHRCPGVLSAFFRSQRCSPPKPSSYGLIFPLPCRRLDPMQQILFCEVPRAFSSDLLQSSVKLKNTERTGEDVYTNENICIYTMTCQIARNSACWSSTVSAFTLESFGWDSLFPASHLTQPTSPCHMEKILSKHI
jgi:hypothetical protein